MIQCCKAEVQEVLTGCGLHSTVSGQQHPVGSSKCKVALFSVSSAADVQCRHAGSNQCMRATRSRHQYSCKCFALISPECHDSLFLLPAICCSLRHELCDMTLAKLGQQNCITVALQCTHLLSSAFSTPHIIVNRYR